MWQYILGFLIVALTTRIVTSIAYVRRTSAGFTIAPLTRTSKLGFWFSGHIKEATGGAPISQARYTFMPFICALTEKYDMPMVYLPGPFIKKRVVLILTDPVAIKECFSNQHMKELHKGPEYEAAKCVLGEGILASAEDAWLKQRRICDMGFSHNIIKNSVEKAANVSHNAIDKWSKAQNKEGKIIIDTLTEFSYITSDVLGHTVFGYDFNTVSAQKPSDAPLYHSLKYILHEIALNLSRIKLFYDGPFLRELKLINNLVDDVIKSEKSGAEKENKTLISHLLEGNYKGVHLTDNEIKDNIKTFMFAGQDTTSSALSWGFYFLAAYPEIQRKAVEEVDKVLGRDRNTPITYENVKTDFVYINNIMREVLRLRPSAAFTKLTKCPITLPGSDGKSYNVAEDVVLHINPVVIQTSKKYWGEDALEFKPERWTALLEGEQNLSSIYFPFSQGHRSCIGANFAKAEFVAVMAKLLQAFEVKLTPETIKDAPRLSIDMTLFPSPFTLELVPR